MLSTVNNVSSCSVLFNKIACFFFFLKERASMNEKIEIQRASTHSYRRQKTTRLSPTLKCLAIKK